MKWAIGHSLSLGLFTSQFLVESDLRVAFIKGVIMFFVNMNLVALAILIQNIIKEIKDDKLLESAEEQK
jgi:hypothetical protein